MKLVLFRSAVILSTVFIFGCVTPNSMQWHKRSASEATTKADISDCKFNTFMWWPFDTLYKCMTRRGYVLIGDDEKARKIEEKERRISAEALIDLKKLKDAGVITEAEYEAKKRKYLSNFSDQTSEPLSLNGNDKSSSNGIEVPEKKPERMNVKSFLSEPLPQNL